MLGVVLAGKILNWLLHFNDTTNFILNTSMFSLIGIAYIVVGAIWDKRAGKVILIFCGLFLITYNFLPENIVFQIVGIACILVPMLIARFSKDIPKMESLN